MATVLILNDKQLFPDSGQSIKLTRENPYFTQSDSYTLDVSLPMDILENRAFFRNIQRIEASKRTQPMTCRLVVDNRVLLAGSARVTQVTENVVKVQLLGGNSEVNFLSNDNGDYIDEMPLGKVLKDNTKTGTDKFYVSSGIRLALSPVNDETYSEWTNHFHFCLIDIVREVLKCYGFMIDSCDLDTEPWNRVFVATAKQTAEVAHTLPHWKPKQLIDEFCKFFNVVLVTDQVTKKASFVSAHSFFTQARRQVVVPVDEYSSEISEESDAHALAADSLAFDMSGSPCHDYDAIPDDVRDAAPRQTFTSKSEAVAAYEQLSAQERLRRIFDCPAGSFAGWQHDYTDVGQEEPETLFTQIDMFGPLLRESSGETRLKICPVAIGLQEYTSQFGQGEAASILKYIMTVPSLENPTGNDMGVQITSSGNWFAGSRSSQADETATIQELVEGDESVEKAEKEDRLQVMFVDDVLQTIFTERSGKKAQVKEYTIGFTDFNYKPSHVAGETHRKWSFSLKPTDADYYLGQLHKNGFSYNMKAKLCVKFLAENIPNPKDVFVIRNKQYGCEKIEANITESGCDHLITSYLYEML